nr:MAG TPA: hypothetical protein [Caudoviricetes sp.]
MRGGDAQNIACLVGSHLRKQSHFLFLRIQAVKYHRHSILIFNRDMASQLNRQLALSIFGCLQAKTASRQCIFYLDCHTATICAVTDPPKISKIALLQVSARCNNVIFACSGAGNVSRAQCQLNSVCIHAQAGKGHLALPTIQMLQLLHVVRAVVDIFTKITVSGHTSGINAASGSADNICIIRCSGRGRCEFFQQNTSVHLQAIKSFLRNNGKFTHIFTSVFA